MRVLTLGPAPTFRMGVPLHLVLICAASTVNRKVAMHTRLFPFTSMGVPSTAKHAYSAVFRIPIEVDGERCHLFAAHARTGG